MIGDGPSMFCASLAFSIPFLVLGISPIPYTCPAKPHTCTQRYPYSYVPSLPNMYFPTHYARDLSSHSDLPIPTNTLTRTQPDREVTLPYFRLLVRVKSPYTSRNACGISWLASLEVFAVYCRDFPHQRINPRHPPTIDWNSRRMGYLAVWPILG